MKKLIALALFAAASAAAQQPSPTMVSGSTSLFLTQEFDHQRGLVGGATSTNPLTTSFAIAVQYVDPVTGTPQSINLTVPSAGGGAWATFRLALLKSEITSIVVQEVSSTASFKAGGGQ
jgi:hypothetical protein